MIDILVAEDDGGFLVRFNHAEKSVFTLATGAFKGVVPQEARGFDEQEKLWSVESIAGADLERFLGGAAAWLQADVRRVDKSELRGPQRGENSGFNVMFKADDVARGHF